MTVLSGKLYKLKERRPLIPSQDSRGSIRIQVTSDAGYFHCNKCRGKITIDAGRLIQSSPVAAATASAAFLIEAVNVSINRLRAFRIAPSDFSPSRSMIA